MPDLGQILGPNLGLLPDVYMRDFIGDTGEPHIGPISSSPEGLPRVQLTPDL